MQCVFSPLAEHDLEEVGDYIARDNPSRAVSFIRELRERCLKIAAAPTGAPLRHELGEGIRQAQNSDTQTFAHLKALCPGILHSAVRWPQPRKSLTAETQRALRYAEKTAVILTKFQEIERQ